MDQFRLVYNFAMNAVVNGRTSKVAAVRVILLVVLEVRSFIGTQIAFREVRLQLRSRHSRAPIGCRLCDTGTVWVVRGENRVARNNSMQIKKGGGGQFRQLTTKVHFRSHSQNYASYVAVDLSVVAETKAFAQDVSDLHAVDGIAVWGLR
jgi:hypothetical protein